MELVQLAPSGLDDTPVNGPPLQVVVRLAGPGRLTPPAEGEAAYIEAGSNSRTIDESTPRKKFMASLLLE